MLSKKELLNAKSASKKIEAGLEIDVVKVGTYDDTDKDGKPIVVGVMVDTNGEVYSTISATVIDALTDLEEILSEEGTQTIVIIQSKSNAGRDFYQLRIK